MFKRVLKAAALPNFRCYDLRHTFATQLLAEGAPITYVAAQLGHSKPTTTLQWYAHWLPTTRRTYVDALDTGAELREAVERVAAALRERPVPARHGSDRAPIGHLLKEAGAEVREKDGSPL